MMTNTDQAMEQSRRTKLLLMAGLCRYMDLLSLLTQDGVTAGQVLVSSTGDGWRLQHVPEESKDSYQTYTLTRQQLVELRYSCALESEFNPAHASASGLDQSYLKTLETAVERLSAILDTEFDCLSFSYDPLTTK